MLQKARGKRTRNPRRNSEICRQPFRCFFDRQPEQPCGKIDHVPIGSTAEAVKTLVQLHTRMAILVKRTAGHAVPIHGQSIVFCRLAGCDEAFDSFEVYKYGASLLYKIPATGNDLNLSTEIREYGRYGRFQVVVFFRVPCFRFCKSILSGMNNCRKSTILQFCNRPQKKNCRFAI